MTFQVWSEEAYKTLEERARYQAHSDDFSGADPTGNNSSSSAISNLFDQAATAGVLAKIGSGKYVCDETLTLKKQQNIAGDGNSAWHAVGRGRNDSPYDVLDFSKGTVIYFTGSAATAYSSRRNELQNMKTAIRCEPGATGIKLRNLKIVCGFDRVDGNGQITTRWNDNRADFDIGLWFRDGDDYALEDVSVVGYWGFGGIVFDGSGIAGDPGLPSVGGIEKVHLHNVTAQGKWGLSILGGDTPATGEGWFGMSNFRMSGGMLFSYSHHGTGFSMTEQQGAVPESGALLIDGLAGSDGSALINHASFDGVDCMSRDHFCGKILNAQDVTFSNCRGEKRPFYISPNLAKRISMYQCEFPMATSTGSQMTIGTGAEAKTIDYSLYRSPLNSRGFVSEPRFERINKDRLTHANFTIEFRKYNGVLQHRITGVNRQVLDIWKLSIDGGWNPEVWANTDILNGSDQQVFTNGLCVGPASFTGKCSIFTPLAVQSVTLGDIEVRTSLGRVVFNNDTNITVEALRYTAPQVQGVYTGWSSAAMMNIRKNSGKNTGNLLDIADTKPALQVHVDGWFFTQLDSA